MSFSLSLKNIRKSFKDYSIYFLTLVFGVAIFYIFNSMDAQQAMMKVSAITDDLIGLMLNMLSGVSVFVSIILGFLIIYANNFLIKRRKKEFGIYMVLGMSKGKISKVLLLETFLVGLISLAVGLVVGIFGSQFMSILVGKMFEVDMSNYEFVFSSAALLKTLLFFGIIYVCVMIFNTFVVSKCKLITLLTASKKSEKVKMKNPILSVLIFIISVAMLSFAYYTVTVRFNDMDRESLIRSIILGAVGTLLLFWSLSGFILRLVQSSKRVYYKNLNMFVLRQMNDKINTTTVSMTIISLMLFLTICILSSALSLNATMTKNLKELTPVSASFEKLMYTKGEYEEEAEEGLKKTNMELLKNSNFDVDKYFKEYLETNVYKTEQITMEKALGNTIEETKKEFPFMRYETQEPLMGISEYNKVARMFNLEEFSLGENEYIIVCDYEAMVNIRDKALEMGTKITIDGKEYSPKLSTCVPGYITNTVQKLNSGIILLPDSAINTSWGRVNYLNVNYNANTDEEIQEIENALFDLERNNQDMRYMNVQTRAYIYESNRGLGATITFIGLYLGIIFLISSAAILALKELSESSDNKERYAILRKIGTDEKMINNALFKQIGMFFMFPLTVAIIHSVFGLQVSYKILEAFGKEDVISSIVITGLLMVVIYGCYFIATYLSSKSIIKED